MSPELPREAGTAEDAACPFSDVRGVISRSVRSCEQRESGGQFIACDVGEIDGNRRWQSSRGFETRSLVALERTWRKNGRAPRSVTTPQT